VYLVAHTYDAWVIEHVWEWEYHTKNGITVGKMPGGFAVAGGLSLSIVCKNRNYSISVFSDVFDFPS